MEKDLDLRKIDLKVIYISTRDNIVEELFIPCLKQSLIYKRSVGFFTSSSLAEIAPGLYDFINNNGKMFLAIGPKLEKGDIKKIKDGYDKQKIIEEAISRGIDEELEDEIDREKVRNLSWLIKNKRLEIKVVVGEPIPNEFDPDFHPKSAIFQDSENEDMNIVTCTGSNNETFRGYRRNYEELEISQSWVGGNDPKKVRAKIEAFDDIWNNKDGKFTTYDFSEALKKKLLKTYRPPKHPIQEKKRLYDCQKTAIKKWEETNFRGILQMATGTGKTRIALECMKIIPNNILVLVIVPQKMHVEQWSKEIRGNGFDDNIIQKVYGKKQVWEKNVHTITKRIDKEEKKRFIVSTIDTARTDGFQSLLSNLKEDHLAMIVDEVHHSGALENRKIFKIPAKFRLGLSATPLRGSWDDGDDKIKEYFDSICYKYDIKEALHDGILSEYNYHIHKVTLPQQDRKRFKEICDRIRKTKHVVYKKYPSLKSWSLFAIINYLKSKKDKIGFALERDTISRAKIIKTTESKIDKLKEIIQTSDDLNRCIIYCNDDQQLEKCEKIMSADKDIFLITASHTPDNEERVRRINSFSDEIGNKFLIAIKILDEGIDIPICDSAILLASSRQDREFVQRRGRILRKHSTKKISNIHDIMVVPYTKDEDKYEITQGEKEYLDEELKRVKIFVDSAKNRKSIDISKF